MPPSIPQFHYHLVLATMTVSLNFPGLLPRKNAGTLAMPALTTSMPFRYNTTQLVQNRRKTKLSIFTKRENSKLYVVPSKNNSNLGSTPLSLSDMVLHLYSCINDKNIKQLGELIADECCFNDCSFPNPFQGKKEVMQFLEQLTTSMGKNVKFNIGHICEGDELTASVDWHLEWKRTRIPFTRGCSSYSCSMKGGRLKIKKAQVLIESPIKPGGLVLVLLKALTSFFDDFPKVAEWFLESPGVTLEWILKVYRVFFKAFVGPLIAGYINLWNLTCRSIGYALRIALFIYKIVF